MTKVQIFGAGAIGKAVAGHIFTNLGCDVMLTDIAEPVIDDLRRRGGYVIYETFYGMEKREDPITGIRAALLSSAESAEFTADADIICVAVGPKGFAPVLSLLCDRLADRSGKPLLLLLMENDAHCDKTASGCIADKLGFLPDWLTIAKSSVERMSRGVTDGDRYDVMSEKFIPLIVPQACVAGTVMDGRSDLIQPVADVAAYYERKLFTNNLGHAVIGYFGLERGCDNGAQAAALPGIAGMLERVLHESGEMLTHRYPEFGDSLPRHLQELVLRYLNADMSDSLLRLCRDPVRKIGRDERIVGAMVRCAGYGLPYADIAQVLWAAMRYNDGDPRCAELARRLNTDGIQAVLCDYCGVTPDEPIFAELLRLYKKN